MTVSARRIQSTLAADLIDRRDVPNLAMRYAETTIKRRMFAQEDAAVVKLATVYRAAFDRLQTRARLHGERYDVRKLGSDKPSRSWRDAFMADVRAEANRLTNESAATGLRAATNAYRQGFYGRLWMLDVSTRADVRIRVPGLAEQDVAGALLREDVYDDLIRSLLGAEWRLQYADQIDDLIVRIKLSISSGMSAGEGIDDIMRRVRETMGVETDRRIGPVGGVQNRQMRANFNRVQAITRTVVNKASNNGAWEAYRQNEDILGGYTWLTARDERVCLDCRGLSGTTYRLTDFYRPPAHPNCRCTIIPIVLPMILIGPEEYPRMDWQDWLTGFGLGLLLDDIA